jgi:nucleoid DNA-binding protein
MQSVTKRDLIDRVVAKTKEKRACVREVAQELLRTITEELVAGNRIELRDFGVFEPVFRPGKTAQNPKTLEPVEVLPKYSIRFKPGRLMKDSVANGEWAQLQLKAARDETEKTDRGQHDSHDKEKDSPTIEVMLSRPRSPSRNPT